MTLRASVTDRNLQLPPPFHLVTLREAGDAFAHAVAIADEAGAGTLVWAKRFDSVEMAVVLEPDEALGSARRAFFVGMNALADALAVHAPPERPITYGWPDAIRVDGVLVGGGRLGWPEGVTEDDVPGWLVFSGTVRTALLRAGEPGTRPLVGALDELGFEGIDPGETVASFARYLMAGFHEAEEDEGSAIRRYRARLSPERDVPAAGAELREALLSPSWRDPKSGMPWL